MGAYGVVTNQYWWSFQYAPASWDGMRTLGNHNVVHLWKVPGNLLEMWESREGAAEHEKVLVFQPMGWKEKLHVGWRGWHPNDFNFLAGPGGMIFQRGLFAEHAGGGGPCFSAGNVHAHLQACS